MKIIISLAGIMVAGIACNSEGSQHADIKSASVDTVVKKDFSNVVFASQRDTTCRMPLRAGIEDTLHFDGKIYGFCSKGCKDAFAERLKTEKKL